MTRPVGKVPALAAVLWRLLSPLDREALELVQHLQPESITGQAAAPTRTAQLAARLGWSLTDTSRVLARLERTGLIVQIGLFPWMPTPLGVVLCYRHPNPINPHIAPPSAAPTCAPRLFVRPIRERLPVEAWGVLNVVTTFCVGKKGLDTSTAPSFGRLIAWTGPTAPARAVILHRLTHMGLLESAYRGVDGLPVWWPSHAGWYVAAHAMPWRERP